MDPNIIEQLVQEYCLVLALAEHKDPEGLFGLAKLDLAAPLGPVYALQQSEWGLAA